MSGRGKTPYEKGELEKMKYDIILAGVGGQGVLSLAAIIAKGAMKDNLQVRQSEVHGMSQRGGAVMSHLRLSDSDISSDLVRKGTADLILGMEPMEVLRYSEFLAPDGVIITAKEPFVNIPNYPDVQSVYDKVATFKDSRLVESVALAKAAGNAKAVNMVVIGAAASVLPVKAESLKWAISELFAAKGAETVAKNLKAFDLGLKK